MRKTLFIILTVLSLHGLVLITFVTVQNYIIASDVRNYLENQDYFSSTLPTIDDADYNVTLQITDKPGIFLIDAKCKTNFYSSLTIDKRHACAVESAATLNPKRMVYFLAISSGLEPRYNNTTSGQIYNALISYDNIKIFYLNIEKYVQGTPLDAMKYWTFKFGANDRSHLLSLVTMWKYGGFYLDPDVITLKSFDELEDNFFGAVDSNALSMKVFGFSMKGAGHMLISQYIEEFFALFRWSREATRTNEPLMRYALSVCGSDSLSDVMNKSCEDLNFYSPNYFFPVPENEWTKMFDENPSRQLLERLEDSYTVCTWNSQSRNRSLRVNSTSAYLRIARKSCPRVLNACNEYF